MASSGKAKPTQILQVLWISLGLLTGASESRAADCNGNGTPDASDVETGRSADENGNQLPDECETAPPGFSAATELPLGSTPRVFVPGDFTGEGRTDLACAFSRGGKKGPGVVLFANPEEAASPAAVEPNGISVQRLVAGDFDGDGDLDLAAIDSDALWTLPNEGKGVFSSASRLLDADGLSGLAAGRMQEGSADSIVLTRRTDDVAIVIPGRADSESSAASQPVLSPAGSSPGALVLLDADGDQDLDVVIASQAGGIQLLENGGRGRLALGPRFELGGMRPELIVARDWNADGRTDLAAAARFSLQTLLHDAGSSFLEPIPFSLSREVPPLRGLTGGDADGDGDLDLAAGLASMPPGALLVWNHGDGTFRAYSRLQLDAAPFLISLDDLDRDGQAELISSQQGRGGLYISWSREAKEVQKEGGVEMTLSTETLQLGFEPHSCALRDFDGDQDLDIGIIDGETNFKLLKNPGDGAFAVHRNYIVRDSLEMISVAAADLDADGDIDVALADESTNNVLVLSNQGKGTFKQTGSYAAGERPCHVCTGDLSGDGKVDILCVNNGSNSLSVFENAGRGNFRGEGSVQVGSRPQAAAAGDLDGDGTFDMAVASYGSSEVWTLFGGGDGRYQRRKRYPVRWPTFVAMADLDADSKLDLSVAGYGSRQVAVFLNRGGGNLAAAAPLDAGAPPYTLLHADVDGDGKPDIVTSNTGSESVSVFLNRGRGEFSEASLYAVGYDPRFGMAGDIDGDADVDILSANHSTLDMTILRNESKRVTPKPRYLNRVCTEAEFYSISLRASPRGGTASPQEAALRETKFVVPVDPGNASLLPPVFQDVKKQPLHQQFLSEVFPTRFPALDAATYDALTGRRASRKYWSGILRSLPTPRGPVYGFSVVGAFSDDASELPRAEEVRAVHETLSKAVALRPLVYDPDTEVTRKNAAAWSDPSFPVRARVEEAVAAPGFVPYTRGAGVGRLRVLTQAAFDEQNLKGALSYQDILVLEHAPRDIEGVVAGIITAEPQGELSHLALRTARRGTPNAFVGNALNALRDRDGKLVKLEVTGERFSITETTPGEATAWWEAHRPRLTVKPIVDGMHGSLDSLEEMVLDSEIPPEARYGGKASNFSRLSRILTGPFAAYREKGFAIPMRWYVEFIQDCHVPSARDPSIQVSGAEFLAEIETWPAFQSDSRLRFETLQRFRESLEASEEMDPDLVARISRRVGEVFGSTERLVRFRSSSNVEDALEFNGAGLYDSTSGCAADEMDGDDAGPCRCDPARPAERSVARAVKHVWASLWNFRAYEERAYYGIPQDVAAMGILVSAAFANERANGVAMTGNPQDPLDRRYIVTMQVDEESVVSPEPGVLAERVLLDVPLPGHATIERVQPSTLVNEGSDVLSDAYLVELAALLRHLDDHFPVDLGGRSRSDVLLDVELKVDSGGCLAIKQARPFLRQDAAPPAPVLELEVPEGAQACGVFVPSRAPPRSLDLKAELRFNPGTFHLSTREEPTPLGGGFAIVEELRLGPGRELARAAGPGVSQATRSSDALHIRYTQPFEIAGKDRVELEMRIDLPGESWTGSGPRKVLDESLLTRGVSLELNTGLVVTFSSCSYRLLPLWESTVHLEGGIDVRLLERHEPPRTLNDTGPAALVKAEVSAPGVNREVDDYWHLVYTSLRHNRAMRYWVVFDPPLDAPGLEKPAAILELSAPEPKLGFEAAARFLDARLGPIASPRVLSFRRSALAADGDSASVPTDCLKGDADGDGQWSARDALAIVASILYCETPPRCLAASDLDESGGLEPADAVLLLQRIFP